MTVTHTFTTSAIPTSLRVTAPAPAGRTVAATASDVLLTIKDVAAACKLSDTAVRRAITDGELPAVKLRSRMRITPEDFNAWIASQRQTAARPSTPLRAADRAPRAAAAGSFRALVHADAARAAGTTAQVQAQ